MGRPFQRFEGLEPGPYLDSASSVPVYVDLGEYEARLAAGKPEIRELLFAGHGLEAAMWTPDWADAALHALDALGLAAETAADRASTPQA